MFLKSAFPLSLFLSFFPFLHFNTQEYNMYIIILLIFHWFFDIIFSHILSKLLNGIFFHPTSQSIWIFFYIDIASLDQTLCSDLMELSLLTLSIITKYIIVYWCVEDLMSSENFMSFEVLMNSINLLLKDKIKRAPKIPLCIPLSRK